MNVKGGGTGYLNSPDHKTLIPLSMHLHTRLNVVLKLPFPLYEYIFKQFYVMFEDVFTFFDLFYVSNF